MDNEKVKVLFPHHEQQSLCTTRLPYRQGRKLTAVKAYSITKESNHLLIFGVPSLNLRQEIKSLFLKFGRLLQFNLSLDHPAESFTETFHAQYEKIQSSRVAKKMLDTKNFYGGSLHICYAPELESIEETKQKLFQRQKDVFFRLKNLEKESVKKDIKDDIVVKESTVKLNMAEENVICFGNVKRRKVKCKKSISETYVPFSKDTRSIGNENNSLYNNKYSNEISCSSGNKTNISKPAVNFIAPLNKTEKVVIKNNTHLDKGLNKNEENIEIVDCTSVDKETITNINESLNYNNFGNEIVKKIPVKPVNKIKFTFL